jgi:hypothetical protein
MERFKKLGENDIFNGEDRTYAAMAYAYGNGEHAGATEGLTWYYVTRTGTTENTTDMKNLYHSFGLAREDDDTWFKAFNIFDQIRAGDMLIATIPQSACGEYIQGSTLEVNVPTSSDTFTTFYGSSIAGYIDQETQREVSNDFNPDRKLNGCSAVWLYRDNPYTGTIHGGRANPNSGLTAWSGANPTTDPTYPHLRATSITRGDEGYDVPEGVALLERGIFVFFDNVNASRTFVSTGVSDTIWTAATAAFNALTVTGGSEEQNDTITNRRAIIFTGATANSNAILTYREVGVAYKTIYFCHAGQPEFNSTSNHTYNHRKSYYRPLEADSVWVTEIGLYNDDNDLVAYGKLSEPVEKNKLETITFKVELLL